jgi:hypothetical protein
MRLFRTCVALALTLGWIQGVSAQTDFFKTATLSELSARPSGLVIADFDDDGALDAAVAGSDRGVVVILVGFNDRTVSEFRSFQAGNVPSGIVTGDFDGDDVLDLVVGNVNDSSVSFLKGNGDATFEDRIATENVGPGPLDLVAIDLNGDDKLDLLVVNEGETDAAVGTVSVMRGVGDGTFVREGSLDADLGSRALAVGRIDADANPDIAVVNNAVNSVSLFYGQGGFQFTIGAPLMTGPSPKAVALGDLNGDGITDIVTGDSNADEVSIFRGSGNRMFAARATASAGTDPTALTITDVNDDGRSDIVVANNRSGDVSLIINEGSGLLRRGRNYVVDQEPLALAIGDMDDDGLLDVVTANSEPSVGVLPNPGDGTLSAVENVVAGNVPESVAAGDVDNDGLTDLVAGGSDGRVLVFRAMVGGGFRAPLLAAERGRAIDVGLGNFDRDDILDLAIADNEANNLAVAKGLGGGRFAAAVVYPIGSDTTPCSPSSLVLADVDGDKVTDIGVTCIGPPALLSVLRGRGDGTFNARQNTQSEGDTPVSVDGGDFNCDGRDDAVVANSASSDVSVMLSNGNGTFTLARRLMGAGSEPNAVAVADFNRDGHADFAVAGKAFPGAPSLHVLAGTASCDGTFAQSDESGGELISALAVRDINGDRIFDLLAAIQINNQLQASRGIGDGKFMVLRGGRPVVSRMPVAVAIGDFDGDGRYDVASANSDASANGLSVATNIGVAALQRGDGNNDQRVSAADLTALMRELGDGDGVAIEEATKNAPQSPIGVDANGDGRVDRQDRVATATRIFTES